MKEFLIFQAGKYPQGNVTREMIDGFIAQFNASKDQIPMFIGHLYFAGNDDAELAHGWINQLRMDGAGKVWATDYEFDDYAREKIAKGNLRKVSIEAFGDGTPENPWTITGAALLGRTPPQIKATFLPALFGKIFGAGAEPQPEPGYPALAIDRDLFGAISLTEEETPMTNEEKQAFEAMQAKVAELGGQLTTATAQLTEMRQNYSAAQQSAAKAEAEAFYGALRDKGIVPPAQLADVVALDQKMSDGERKLYREYLAAKKPVVEAGGQHFANQGTAPKPAPANDDELVREIKKYQAEHGIKSFGEAAELYYATANK